MLKKVIAFVGLLVFKFVITFLRKYNNSVVNLSLMFAFMVLCGIFEYSILCRWINDTRKLKVIIVVQFVIFFAIYVLNI